MHSGFSDYNAFARMQQEQRRVQATSVQYSQPTHKSMSDAAMSRIPENIKSRVNSVMLHITGAKLVDGGQISAKQATKAGKLGTEYTTSGGKVKLPYTTVTADQKPRGSGLKNIPSPVKQIKDVRKAISKRYNYAR